MIATAAALGAVMKDLAQDVWAELSAGHAELTAVAVLALGLLLARLIRAWIRRGLERLGEPDAETTVAGAGVGSTAVRRIADASFWLLLGLAILVALRTLGSERLGDWLDPVLGYVPRLLAAIAILVGGWILASMARDLLQDRRVEAVAGAWTPRLTQVAILALAGLTALEQLGFSLEVVLRLLVLVLGISLGGLALAFALGARQHVANLLARETVERFSAGDRVRIDDTEGTIVEIHRTGVDLVNEEGVVTVPAARFCDRMVTRLVDRDGTLGMAEPGDGR